MSIICIAKGTATIGLTTRGADGKIISQTPARWEHDPDGGCVALWTMNPETEEQEAPGAYLWRLAGVGIPGRRSGGTETAPQGEPAGFPGNRPRGHGRRYGHLRVLPEFWL